MNRLVKALLTRPPVAELAIQPDSVPFDLLRDALGDALFSTTEWESLSRNAGAIRDLHTGYLPTINASDWNTALRLAEETVADGRAGWWTIMIPWGSNFGLTVPQDSTGIELIALFTGPLSNSRTIAYDVTRGSVIDVSATHCSPPSWGICAPGSCGGCKARQVWDPATRSKGIKCRCPDQGA
jgi:hypothetical protein